EQTTQQQTTAEQTTQQQTTAEQTTQLVTTEMMTTGSIHPIVIHDKPYVWVQVIVALMITFGCFTYEPFVIRFICMIQYLLIAIWSNENILPLGTRIFSTLQFLLVDFFEVLDKKPEI